MTRRPASSPRTDTLFPYTSLCRAWLSTTKSDLFGTEGWVGLANFARLFGDPIFLQTVWNTFYFVLLTVPLLAVLGLALALVLNRPARWAAVLRTIFFA